MNEQERQVISDIFQRLQSVANQPRDPEAERFIAEMIRRQPYAPYAMAQAIFVQEQAVTNLNARVEELQAENEQLRSQPQGGGLLSSIFGGGSRPEPRDRSYGAEQSGPWGRAGGSVPQAGGYGGQPGYAQQGGPFAGGMGGGAFGGGRGGGGFLQTAMATAVGAAGGMMLGSALANAFDGGGGGHETGGHNAFASGEGASDGGGITDSLYQNASDQDAGLDDFGGDAGDDGDWT